MHDSQRLMLQRLPAGAQEARVEEGSIRQEAGAGISGRVQGHTVAVGSLEWVQQSASAPAPPTSAPVSGPGQESLSAATAQGPELPD